MMSPTKMKFNPPKKKKITLLVKTRLRSKMKYEFLADYLLVYIEK
jgi:hypothetical protein